MDHTHAAPAAHDTAKRSSNRAFGIVFATVFAVIALWPLIRGREIHGWSLWIAAAFAALAVFAPALLTWPNRLWLAFGGLLHKITSPVALGLIFYIAIMPFGVAMRLFGKDFLALRRRPEQASYWVLRSPPGPPPDSLKNQF
jgi:hypothetical protein